MSKALVELVYKDGTKKKAWVDFDMGIKRILNSIDKGVEKAHGKDPDWERWNLIDIPALGRDPKPEAMEEALRE